MPKSADAFRTISEVSADIGVPQHVLRFWETKFAEVKPLKRGGGRRYYRPDDVQLLRAINGLLYTDGFTIKGVQKLLRERGAAAVAAGQGGAASLAARETDQAPQPGMNDNAAEEAESGGTSAAPAPLSKTRDEDFLTDLRSVRDQLSAALQSARSV